MKIRLLILIPVFFLLAAQSASADFNLTYAPPCLVPADVAACPEISDSIAGYLLRLYNFALGIVGAIAFGTIVVGGLYIAFSGAVDKKKEGKEMITSALLGIAILLGSWLILNTINPQIPELKEPGLEKLTLAELDSLNLPNIISAENMVYCGHLKRGSSQLNAESVCSSTKWPFVAYNTSPNEAKEEQDDQKPGWVCRDPLDPGEAISGLKFFRACEPALEIDIYDNKRAFAAFYVQGTKNFKEKVAANVPYRGSMKALRPEDPARWPIKDGGNCTTGENGQMQNCVCVWKPGEQSVCQIDKRIDGPLTSFLAKMEVAGIQWQITEAYPPTVMHSESCHFNGKCVDITVSSGNCADVTSAITYAEESRLDVEDEYENCGGRQTRYGSGPHLHLSL